MEELNEVQNSVPQKVEEDRRSDEWKSPQIDK